MEFSGIVVLAIVWFLVSLVSRLQKQRQGESQQPRKPWPPDGGWTGGNPTQQEGKRLELVLREFQRALEQAGSTGRPTQLPRPRQEVRQLEARQAEEGTSLEIEPEVASLEADVSRVGRRRIDQDDEAEQIAARRIKEAEARDAARAQAKESKVEPTRQEPADHTATPAYTAQQLRDAVVWREILGPPVSLRDSHES